MSTWQLQEAKNKLSAVINRAVSEGPQFITRWGNKLVVILSVDRYEELTGAKKPFHEFLLDAPKAELNLTRSSESARDLDL